MHYGGIKLSWWGNNIINYQTQRVSPQIAIMLDTDSPLPTDLDALAQFYSAYIDPLYLP